MAEIHRRKTFTATIGAVRVGSNAPVMVQSMTNTDTADIPGTIKQVAALARAGSEVVRVTVNNDDAAKAIPHIVEGLEKQGLRVPIIGDFHYNGHLLLTKYAGCAEGLAKYRINPGNASIGRKNDDNFRTMIEVAVKHQKPVRIGVNWGSLDQSLLTKMMDENSRLPEPKEAREVTMEAIVVSALSSAKLAEQHGLRPDQIILSAKVSGVQDLIDVYRMLASRCEYPLHLGLTEAGHGGEEQLGRLRRGHGGAAARRHRRHHSRFAHARSRRRSRRRSSSGPADPAVARHSLKQIEGSQAMAQAIALCRPEVICAYPITPQTRHRRGSWQSVKVGALENCEFINVESEFAALSVAIGASAAGARLYRHGLARPAVHGRGGL